MTLITRKKISENSLLKQSGMAGYLALAKCRCDDFVQFLASQALRGYAVDKNIENQHFCLNINK